VNFSGLEKDSLVSYSHTFDSVYEIQLILDLAKP